MPFGQTAPAPHRVKNRSSSQAAGAPILTRRGLRLLAFEPAAGGPDRTLSGNARSAAANSTRKGVNNMRPQQQQQSHRPEQRRRPYSDERTLAGTIARRIIRELHLEDTTPNWRTISNIIAEAIRPERSDE